MEQQTEINSFGRRVAIETRTTVDPMPTLAEQLPELSPRIGPWETLTVLLRPVRNEQGHLACTAKAILVTAPAGGKAAWLPLSKVSRHAVWAGKHAAHPFEFFRIPAWLYKAKRTEMLAGAETAISA